MPVRALIIAIESYPGVQGASLAKQLPGTLAAGVAFRDWLLAKWAAEQRPAADTEIIFCSEPAQAFGTSAKQADILTALTTLKAHGQNKTDELFFFFSGHGFSFVPQPGSRADFVISSDFIDPTLSGHCCLPLDLIVNWLRAHLGPGKHFYFVDACRNPLNAAQIQPGGFLPFDAQGTAEAATFVLQSTTAGAVAPVGGPFPLALMAGLKGVGKAKVWEQTVPNGMVVKYESLRRHLRDTLPQPSITSRVDGDGESEAILATITPVPMSNCTVNVVGAPAGSAGQLSVTRGRAPVPTVHPLQPPTLLLPLQPDDYWLGLQLPNATVDPAGPVLVDMYSDQSVQFRATPLPPPPPPAGAGGGGPPSPAGGPQGFRGPSPAAPPSGPPPGARVNVEVPPRGRVELRNIDTGVKLTIPTSASLEVPQGRYLATLLGQQGELIKREEIELTAGQMASIELSHWETSLPHRSIAERLPHDRQSVDFSESLGGAIEDTDLSLWLALLGGGRILGPRGDYSKIAPFPLHDFSNEAPGASPIYLLAGFEDPSTRLRVGLAGGPRVQWQDATRPDGMPGILHAYLPVGIGSGLLSFRTNDSPPYTLATATMANRALLVILTQEDDGSPRISQFLLPLGHLIGRLPAAVQQYLQHRNHLADVRFLALASRAFRKRRDLAKAVPSDTLMEVFYTKWVDPIASAMAAYESLRRGNSDTLKTVTRNMVEYFPELPDSLALARLGGNRTAEPKGIPLFQDGLRAFPERLGQLPLPQGLLDFNSPWTLWRGGIEG